MLGVDRIYNFLSDIEKCIENRIKKCMSFDELIVFLCQHGENKTRKTCD
jgi:hypothetical protein